MDYYASGEYTIKIRGQEEIRTYLAKYQVKSLLYLAATLGIREIVLVKEFRR